MPSKKQRCRREKLKQQMEKGSAKEPETSGIDVDLMRIMIGALQKTNQEIVERIESIQKVKRYEYNLKVSESVKFEVKETVREEQVSQILKEYECKKVLVSGVGDFFTGQPERERRKDWEELKSLNAEIATCLSWFDNDQPKAKEALPRIRDNLEVIQTALGEVEELTMTPPSKLTRLKSIENVINKSVRELSAEGVRVERPDLLNFVSSSVLTPAMISKLVDWYGSGWKLQYSGMQDGWRATTYHDLCDGRGKTITVLRAKGHVFGFFMSRHVSSNAFYEEDAGASIFKLGSNNWPASSMIKVSTVAKRCAIGDARLNGPYFSPDLYIADRANENWSSRAPAEYSNSYIFSPSDIEVYVQC